VPLEVARQTDPQAVLSFVERLHAAGVLQRDLHPGNLLVRANPLEIRLVDLHGTILKSALTPAERANNLALLCGGFPLPVDWKVRRRSAELRRRFLHARSRRSLRHNREFGTLRAGGLRWWARLPAVTDITRRILEQPDVFLAQRARLMKNGRSSTVGAADGLVLKRYNLRKVGNVFKDLFRPSKARKSYRKAYHLEMAGVATPRVLATADRHALGLVRRSYLLMEEIPGATSLGAYLQRCPALDLALVRQAAQLVGSIHRLGLTHRDLKETNLVLDGAGRLYLLDLEGLDYVDVVSPQRTAADLERLARGVQKYPVVTARHRAAFLRHYCRVRGLTRLR
jgi:tRNA A-37 threonylcarbamoyl transferase component Bud32